MLADLRDPGSLAPALEGADAVACCTGTTAFPSKRWDGGNGPEQTDYVSVRNLVAAAAAAGPLRRFVLTTSAGVERSGSLPFSILNLFGELGICLVSSAAVWGPGLGTAPAKQHLALHFGQP